MDGLSREEIAHLGQYLSLIDRRITKVIHKQAAVEVYNIFITTDISQEKFSLILKLLQKPFHGQENYEELSLSLQQLIMLRGEVMQQSERANASRLITITFFKEMIERHKVDLAKKNPITPPTKLAKPTIKREEEFKIEYVSPPLPNQSSITLNEPDRSRTNKEDPNRVIATIHISEKKENNSLWKDAKGNIANNDTQISSLHMQIEQEAAQRALEIRRKEEEARKLKEEQEQHQQEIYSTIQEQSTLVSYFRRFDDQMVELLSYGECIDLFMGLSNFSSTQEEFSKIMSDLKSTLSGIAEVSPIPEGLLEYIDELIELRNEMLRNSASARDAREAVRNYFSIRINQLIEKEAAAERFLQQQEKNEQIDKLEDQETTQRIVLEEIQRIKIDERRERKQKKEEEAKKISRKLQKRHERMIAQRQKEKEQKHLMLEAKKAEMQQFHEHAINERKLEKEAEKNQLHRMHEERKREREEQYRLEKIKQAAEKAAAQQLVIQKKRESERQYQDRLVSKREHEIEIRKRAIFNQKEREQQYLKRAMEKESEKKSSTVVYREGFDLDDDDDDDND